MRIDLRATALHTTASDLGFEGGDDKTVYGLVMDFDEGTLVCFLTGDASLYLASGGALIGGGAHDSIAGPAQYAVEVAATAADGMVAAADPPIPAEGTVQFIVMAVGELLAATAPTHDVGAGPFAPLYAAAQDVLAAIREFQTDSLDGGPGLASNP